MTNNNETKRDVFKTLAHAHAWVNYGLYEQYLNQYDTALPDYIPVVPKEIGEWIKKMQNGKCNLGRHAVHGNAT